jgi:hypothetical protein
VGLQNQGSSVETTSTKATYESQEDGYFLIQQSRFHALSRFFKFASFGFRVVDFSRHGFIMRVKKTKKGWSALCELMCAFAGPEQNIFVL